MAKTAYISTDQVRLNPDNPRTRTSRKFAQLIRSVAQFPNALYLRGVVVRTKKPPKGSRMTIYGGNQRWEAILAVLFMPEAELAEILAGSADEGQSELWAELRDRKAVPADWIVDGSRLSDAELRRFVIIDNESTGQDDWKALHRQYTDQELEDYGKDLQGYGESDDDVDPDAVTGSGKPSKVKPDNYVVRFNIHTDIKAGDLFEIGPHRLLCGNCVEADNVERLLQGTTPEVMVTDPPYCSGGFQEAQKSGGSIGTDAEIKWGGKRPDIANDTLSTRGWQALLRSAFMSSQAHALYCFIDWRMWTYLFDLAEECGFGVRSMIVWNKESPGMGMIWRTQHELVLFGMRTKVKFDNTKAGTNVINAKRSGNKDHPTQKPVDLVGKLLEVTYWAKNVYDPFIGSGTTMVAAHQLGRKCYAMEMSPMFCHTTIDRMLKLDPTLTVLRNGQPYELPEFEIAEKA